MRRRLSYYFLLILLMLAGCSKRPASAWRVVAAPPPQLLIPPRADAPVALGQDTVVLNRARSNSSRNPACNLALPGFNLQWEGRKAAITADTKALIQAPALVEVTSPDGARRMIPGVSLEKNWFQLLPSSLEAKAAAGCLSPADARLLPARLASSLTLPPGVSWRLLHGDPTLTGYLDLQPGFVLKSVTPLRESGQVAGYLTAYYRTAPNGAGGVKVSAGESESNLRGYITRGVSPDHDVLHLPPKAIHLRLFLRTWSLAQDRRIALVAAPSVALLDRATREFETDPERYCREAAAQSVACVAIEKDSVLHAEISVLAKGTPLYLQAGGTLGMAMRQIGMKLDTALPTSLTLQRPYDGKLLPVEFPLDPAMLQFVLWNGDVMSW